MEPLRDKGNWPVLVAVIALAVTISYAVSAFRTAPAGRTPPGPPVSRPRIDVSRGSVSAAFTDSSPISTRATVRFAASPANVSKGKDIYCAASHCSFVLSGVLASDVWGRTVKILGDYPGSTSELTYTCHNCSAGLSLDTLGIPHFTRARGFSGPGVLLTLNADATALEIECRAQTCTTRQENEVAREFPRGRTVSLPVNQNIQFSFSRP